MHFKRLTLSFVLFLSFGSVAFADTLTFTLSGVENGSFQFSTNPIPDSSGTGTMNFYNVAYTNLSGTSLIKISFYTGANGGGMSDDFDSGYYGLQLYTGTQSHPIFAPGVFHLSTDGIHSNETLKITSTASVVTPEPSTFLLLLTGLGSAGVLGRGRRSLMRAVSKV